MTKRGDIVKNLEDALGFARCHHYLSESSERGVQVSHDSAVINRSLPRVLSRSTEPVG